MVGPDWRGRGGIASVVKIYRSAGLFDRLPIKYLVTHAESGKLKKLAMLISSLSIYLFWLMSGRISLVHVHTASRSSFYRKSIFILLAIIFQRPFILHLHGGGFIEFYRNESGWLSQAYIRWLFKRATVLLLLTPYWQQAFKAITTNPRIQVLYNPVVITSAQPRTLGRHPPTLLFLGSIERNKGIYDLLHALPALVKKFPELRLCCGGTGEIHQAKLLADQLGMAAHVEFLGWVKGAQKQRLFDIASLLVVPSYFEALSMSALEALAHGIPVVGTRVGGIPDIVEDGLQGRLVAAGDASALAAAIAELIENPSFYADASRNALQKARNCFSADLIVPRLEAIYSQTLAGARRRR